MSNQWSINGDQADMEQEAIEQEQAKIKPMKKGWDAFWRAGLLPALVCGPLIRFGSRLIPDDAVSKFIFALSVLGLFILWTRWNYKRITRAKNADTGRTSRDTT